MTPTELVRTIYLGDRACRRIIVDGWGKSVSLQVDLISRIRSSSGEWDFYADEDIEDGFLVFEGVTSFRFEPQGLVPNDWIDITDVRKQEAHLGAGPPQYLTTISLGAVDSDGNGKEVMLTISAARLGLIDPAQPGVKLYS